MTEIVQQTPVTPPSAPVTPPSPTPALTNQPTSATPKEGEPALVNAETKPEAKPEGAPEKYAAFTLPEGATANESVITEASGIFKELGLSQAQAQRLVDFYSKDSLKAADAGVKLWQDTQQTWRDEVKNSPDIGGAKLGPVMATINKAINTIGDAKLIDGFREAMNITGAGNNPAFIRAFYAMAQKLTEGGPVSGSPTAAKPQLTGAAAMYPNLKSSG